MNAPSTLLLYRFHHGELEGDERNRVREAIEADPDTRARYQEILAAEAEFAVLPVPASIAALDRPARRPWWLVSLGGFAAVAAAFVLVVGVGAGSLSDPHHPPGISEDTVRTKGEIPELEVWIGAPEGARPLRDGEAVTEGDRIQLSFNPNGRRLATFAGRDGTGVIEVYGTVEADRTRGLQSAPFALELDNAPGPQTFFVLGHDEPLTPEELDVAFRDGTGDIKTVVLPKRLP